MTVDVSRRSTPHDDNVITRMTEPLYELLTPYLDALNASPRAPSASDPLISTYLNRLTTLSLASLSTTEPESLTQSSNSVVRSLQALSKRSYKAIITSSDQLSHLSTSLPKLSASVKELEDVLPSLDNSAGRFAQKYARDADNDLLDRRRKAMLLARNVDRVSDILELPSLLSSAISSSAQSATGAGTTPANSSYASALDLHAHIKRLHTLYPEVRLVSEIHKQAEEEMKLMTTNLITSMQGQNIKLAGAMRTIGWLRRVAPELDDTYTLLKGVGSIAAIAGSSEGSLGAVFLLCRLTNLLAILEALEPLRDLADQETTRRTAQGGKWAGGQQTERYLKRYIEIFREQSFAIVSMYKSIFPSALPTPEYVIKDSLAPGEGEALVQGGLTKLPSALATFPMHLTEMLFDTFRAYLTNVRDKASRDSLLTQVLYCAGSLGRLGGDFGMMLALLEEDLRSIVQSDEDEAEAKDETEESRPEWVNAMKKHRIQASRLELLASGVGTGSRSSSMTIRSPPIESGG